VSGRYCFGEHGDGLDGGLGAVDKRVETLDMCLQHLVGIVDHVVFRHYLCYAPRSQQLQHILRRELNAVLDAAAK
jgi:hypothetical protein